MSGSCVLAIDCGSGGGRALIIDLGGSLLACAVREWQYETPEDVGPMGKEFDAEQFWGIICSLVREAIGRAGILPEDILAVSSASQREGVVFLDREGNELYAGPNVDLRGLVEGFSIDEECGPDVYRITGHAPSLIFAPARLRWFRNNRPEVYERIDTVLSISDWVLYRLSGERVGEVSCVSDIGLMDIHSVEWSVDLIERLGVPAGICPVVVAAGTRVGSVTTKAASETGLAGGTTVVAGGADTQCGLTGMGVRDPGQIGIVAGWSGVIQMVTGEPMLDTNGRIWSSCHSIPGRWVLESNAQETGGSYDWLRRTLFAEGVDEEDSYRSMDSMALSVPVGSNGVFAFIGPRLMNMSSLKPLVGGFLFPITPSVTSVGGDHLVRAAMENICYALKANVGQLQEVSGLDATDISIGGGLAQSDVIVQTLADVLDRDILAFRVRHVTSWGTAIFAAAGAAAYSSLDDATDAMRPEHTVFEPDPRSARQYDDCYERWRSLADVLDGL